MVDLLALPATPAVLAVLPRLRAALRGTAPMIPYAVGSPPPAPVPDSAPLPADLAAILGTSGSTGSPKRALLTAAALTASAHATHAHLGGSGQWLLALPPHHIAGLQVLLRSVVAQSNPIVMDLTGGFEATAFTTAIGQLDPGQRRYTSLVPAQLTRLLDDPAATAALADLDAVLLGGQALDPRLRARAQGAGVQVIATYGMTETAGGCVYDGLPSLVSGSPSRTPGPSSWVGPPSPPVTWATPTGPRRHSTGTGTNAGSAPMTPAPSPTDACRSTGGWTT